MTRDGYSRKRKSLWLEEALFSVRNHDPDLSQSLVGDRVSGPEHPPDDHRARSGGARRVMKDLIIRLRLQVPTIEGVQSLVLRCAMRFRIRNPERFVRWDDRNR